MNKKILIIDDNIEICEMYKKIFELEGYNVKTELDGLKGIVTSVEFNPDVIILDIMMPQTNGFEVLESLKSHTSLETIILVNSNLSTEKDENKAMSLGADKYLRKSEYTPSQVSDIVRDLFKTSQDTKSKTILIIDDNKEICEMYKVVLNFEGYKTVIENDGLKGLTTALEVKPDIIILDIMMPHINGYEVLTSIKQHSSLDTIIIVNSNLNSIADEKKALDLGAKRYLRKSDYTPLEVLEIIKKI